jgi:DNA-binding NarL/FixJ family response regulator
MEIATAVVLGGRAQVRIEITSVLAAQAVCVPVSTDCISEAVEAVRLQRPSIVVLDNALFDIESINAVRQLRRIDRHLKIIVITQQNPQHLSARYQRAGATVVLGAAHCLGGLKFILGALRAGYAYFDFIYTPINPRQWSFDKECDLIATLTDRQLTIFQALAVGLSNQAIADQMGIGSRSVSVHKTDIFEKLQLDSLSQLYSLALRNKLT